MNARNKHIYERLGAMLRAARKGRGMRQEDVAERLGLSRTTIVNMEQGRQGVSVAHLLEFMRLYGVTKLDRNALLGRDFL